MLTEADAAGQRRGQCDRQDQQSERELQHLADASRCLVDLLDGSGPPVFASIGRPPAAAGRARGSVSPA